MATDKKEGAAKAASATKQLAATPKPPPAFGGAVPTGFSGRVTEKQAVLRKEEASNKSMVAPTHLSASGQKAADVAAKAVRESKEQDQFDAQNQLNEFKPGLTPATGSQGSAHQMRDEAPRFAGDRTSGPMTTPKSEMMQTTAAPVSAKPPAGNPNPAAVAAGTVVIEGKGTIPVYIDGGMVRLQRGKSVKLSVAQLKYLDDNEIKYTKG